MRDLKEGYRQNVALLGRRAIGKTVLLEKLMAEWDDDVLIPVELDLENQDLQDIYEKMTGRLLFHFFKRKGLPFSDNLKSLTEVCHHELPSSYKAIKKIQSFLAHDKKGEAFREIIALPQTFAKETGSFCILFWDEFHALEGLLIPGAFRELGKKIMTQNLCLYIVASSKPAVARRILSEKLSLLFGNFEIVPLEAFDPKTSREFIAMYLQEIRLKDLLRDFIVDLTGGHPLFLTLICRELVSLTRAYQQNEIFTPLVTQALENLLFQPWGILNRHFSQLIDRVNSPRENLVVSRLLLALAAGKQKIKQIVGETGMKAALVRHKLNYLIEQGIVIRNGSFYYLEDKLFKFWLRWEYQQRKQSFDIELGTRLEQFRQGVDGALKEFDLSARKDLTSRIQELLFCFEDETCFINGRRYRLPVFRDVVPAKAAGKGPRDVVMLRASTEAGDWMIALKAGAIGENDLNVLLTESRRRRGKPQKCVLISLAEIDENVRIRALQERMWIWNEGEVNALLTIYNKPYLI